MKSKKLTKKPSDDYRHGNLKGALINAAIESIGQTGEVEFSLRDLAEKAGVTHAAAYRHFSSKKDILLEIARDGFARLGEEFKNILAANSEAIVELGVCYVRFAVNNPCHFKVMFHPDVKAIEASGPPISLGRKTFGYLCDSVEANKRAGKFVDQPVQSIALTAWSAVHGLSMLLVNEDMEKRSKAQSIELASTLTAHLMSGFLKR